MTALLRAGVRRAVAGSQDAMVRNSWLIMTTTLMMAGAGGLFWVIAARLHSAADVGLAGSLVTTAEALAVFSMLGLNVSLIRILPTSSRPAGDVTVSCLVVLAFGTLLAIAYVLVLPVVSPRLHQVFDTRWVTLAFAVLAGLTAVNQLTDGVFLGINRLWPNLWINGVVQGVLRCSLPFVLAGGAVAIYAAVGLSAGIAGALCLVAVLLHLRAVPSLRISAELHDARRFAGAGYLSSVLYIAPQLVFPVLVINGSGPRQNALYFISFQIVALLNAIVYAACNSMYAEAERQPHLRRDILRRGGRLALVYAVVGGLALWVAAPLVLEVFGGEYRENAVGVLRILTLGSLGVALNYWAAMRLRVAHHLVAMVVVQLIGSAAMIALAVALAGRGAEAVAVAWGVGQGFGGVLGWVVSRVWAPVHDEPPVDTANRRPGDC